MVTLKAPSEQSDPEPAPSRPSRSWRCLLALTILVTIVGSDQATKRIATDTLQGAAPRIYLGDTLRLEYTLNGGGFLGVGSQFSHDLRFSLFIGFNLCLMLGVAVFLIVKWRTPATVFVALLCILAGGIGNMVDRITQNGLVIDFLNVGMGPLRTGIFNVADVGITFGTLALFVGAWTRKSYGEPGGARYG